MFFADAIPPASGNQTITYLTGVLSGAAVPLVQRWFAERKEKRELDAQKEKDAGEAKERIAREERELKARSENHILESQMRNEESRRLSDSLNSIAMQMQSFIKVQSESIAITDKGLEMTRAWHAENRLAISTSCKASCNGIVFKRTKKSFGARKK